jgi:hypothetical protein
MKKFTPAQRIAIAENQRLVELLTGAGTPHAKDLAILVLGRIAAIGDGADVAAASEDDTRTMVAFAQQNTIAPDDENPENGAAARALKGQAN